MTIIKLPPSLQNGEHQNPQQLADEVKIATTLCNIGLAISSSRTLRDVVLNTYHQLKQVIDTSNFAIAIYDAPTDTLSFGLIVSQKQGSKPFAVRYSTNQRITKQIIQRRIPLLFPNFQQTEYQTELQRISPPQSIQSWLGVPIHTPTLKDHPADGALLFWQDTPNHFTEQDLWVASTVALQVSTAIRNAQLVEASQRRAREATILNKVARTLASTLSLDEVLTLILKQVETLLNSEAGAILLTDTETGELIFQTAFGGKAEEIKPFRIPKGQGIAGEIALTGEPLLIADVRQDKRHFKELDKQTDFLTRNMIAVPLILHEQIVGVLEVMNKRSGNFTNKDLELLQSVASYAAIAIENAKLHNSVLAERDRVIEAEEQARRELARDLHDGPTQLVAGILMSLDFSKKALEKDPSLLPKELEDMTDLASRASHQMRTLLFELRPLVLETSGLQSAIEVFMERRQKDIGDLPELKVVVETPNNSGEITRSEKKVETTIFAIVQETVNNAIKHAMADTITVTLRETDDALYTVIADDGNGFDVEAVMSNYESRGSLGMINLQERTELIGAELTIDSSPGTGASFTLFLPKSPQERLRRRVVTGPLSLSQIQPHLRESLPES